MEKGIGTTVLLDGSLIISAWGWREFLIIFRRLLPSNAAPSLLIKMRKRRNETSSSPLLLFLSLSLRRMNTAINGAIYLKVRPPNGRRRGRRYSIFLCPGDSAP